MAKVEQKVTLENQEYIRNLRQLRQVNQTELKRVNKEFDSSTNAVDSFTQQTKKGVGETNKSLGGLAKNFRSALGTLSGFAGVGGIAALGGAAAGQVVEGLNFSTLINQISTRRGFGERESADLRRNLLGVSSRTGVEEEEIASVAEQALSRGAGLDQAVSASELIAAASRASQLGAAELGQRVISDLQARGQELSSENIESSLQALIVATRGGFTDLGQALQAIESVSPEQANRLGLSQRDLAELFSAGRAGVAVSDTAIDEAISELIRSLDSLEEGAVKGLFGTDFGKSEGQFSLSAENLDKLAENLDKLGGAEAATRKLLGQQFSPQAAEGIIALARDRGQFTQQRQRLGAQQVSVDETFQQSTSGLASQFGLGLNKFGNLLKGGAQRVSDEELSGLGIPTGSQDRGFSIPSNPRTKNQAAPIQTIDNNKQQLDLKVTGEFDVIDAGFIARPKTIDVTRDAGGL